jgi:hypothetical protein
MDGIRLARMPLSQAANAADWYDSLSTEAFATIDPVDMDAALVEQVYALYKIAYAHVPPAGQYLLASAGALFEYDVWVLLHADDDLYGSPIAFMLARTTVCGIKGGLTGGDGTKPANKAVLTLKTSVLNRPGVFTEVSEPIEGKLWGKVPHVGFPEAQRVLAALGKTDAVAEPDGIHYRRRIGSLGSVRKVMVGRPHVPDAAE